MCEIYPRLFIGSKHDLPISQFVIVHACKTFHKSFLGYSGNACPKDHPNYWYVIYNNELFMNIVDAPKPEFFSQENLIDPALFFINKNYKEGANIFIHCDKGESRSPSLGFLYLYYFTEVFKNTNLNEAILEFKTNLYPNYKPNKGMEEFISLYKFTP